MLSDRQRGARAAQDADRRSAGRRAAWIAAAALVAALGTARADPTGVSRAETLLFMTPHLKDLQPPSRLHYAFLKRGTLETGFSDTVDVDITGQPDGSKKGIARFFSGSRQIKYPEVEHAEGNPVLLFYLEREIREMSRLTGGQPNHFRQRIRTALAESARVKDIEIRVGGQTRLAQQITISPYDADPNRDRYERLAAKQYVFTICETIPGAVYEVQGVVPAASGSPKDEAVLDETLTFMSAGAPR
jgi:hypothetical protein